MAITSDEVLEYMSKSLGVSRAAIDSDTLLFSTGVLDSFSLVDLVTFVEKNTGLKVKVGDVNLDNFDSVGKIIAFCAANGV